jgi:DNA-binding NarL/FixJ family response regulator
VVIADDHPVVSNGLKNMLSRQKQIKVNAIYNSATDLLENMDTVTMDVLILDMQLPDGNGMDIAGKIMKAKPGTRILVFSSSDIIYQVKKMLQAGCYGYLLKDADDKMIVQAIETVYESQRFLPPVLEKALLDDMIRNKNKLSNQTTLSKREKEVLELILKEYTSQEIADELFLSTSTIEFHRNSLQQKLGAKNIAGLVKAAIQRGLI